MEFDHNLLSTDEVTALVVRLRAGDETVKHSLIQQFLRLAAKIASRYAVRHRIRADDLFSEAYLGVVQAVEWAPTRLTDDNIAPYIVVTVCRFINDYVARDRLIRVPRKREIPPIFPLEHFSKFLDGSWETQGPSNENFDIGVLDVFDKLTRVIVDEREWTIVRLRIQGKSQQEIADDLGITAARVCQLLKGIQDRYGLSP